MDFGKKLLEKYGWKDGDGLGKDKTGIVKPLKANLKFDNAGLGVDKESEFNNHWWQRVFNEAAENVQVSNNERQVSMALKNPNDEVEITTKLYSSKKLQKAKQKQKKAKDTDVSYRYFLQSSTLTNTGEEVNTKDKVEISDIAVKQFKVLTDEELFKACEGRTAHKGARHGLKLSGKLARLKQQEEELLQEMQQKANQLKAQGEIANEKMRMKVSSNQKSQKRLSSDCLRIEPQNSENIIQISSNHKLVEENAEEGFLKIKKEKIKRKNKGIRSEENEEETPSATIEVVKHKKKKKHDLKANEEAASAVEESSKTSKRPCMAIQELSAVDKEQAQIIKKCKKKKFHKN